MRPSRPHLFMHGRRATTGALACGGPCFWTCGALSPQAANRASLPRAASADKTNRQKITPLQQEVLQNWNVVPWNARRMRRRADLGRGGRSVRRARRGSSSTERGRKQKSAPQGALRDGETRLSDSTDTQAQMRRSQAGASRSAAARRSSKSGSRISTRRVVGRAMRPRSFMWVKVRETVSIVRPR